MMDLETKKIRDQYDRMRKEADEERAKKKTKTVFILPTIEQILDAEKIDRVQFAEKVRLKFEDEFMGVETDVKFEIWLSFKMNWLTLEARKDARILHEIMKFNSLITP